MFIRGSSHIRSKEILDQPSIQPNYLSHEADREDAVALLRLIRRIRRDMTERGRTLEHVLQQHLTTVHPMHERYVEPTRAYADVVVANDGLMEDAVERVLAAIRRRTAGGLAATAPERQPS